MHASLVMAVLALGAAANVYGNDLGEVPPTEDQEVDDGVCVPLKCSHGAPPAQCTRLCALKSWLPVCRGLGASQDCVCQGPAGELRSPDEMEPKEPPPPSYVTVFFWDLWGNSTDSDSADSGVWYEAVDVHRGRLLWDFRMVLGGLLVLMAALVAYELFLCCRQNARASKVAMDPFDLYGVEKPDAKKEMPMVI